MAQPPAEPHVDIVVDDTSPLVLYTPPADGTAAPAGWASRCAAPGPSTAQCVGTSLHVTSADGAALSLRWNGTAVALYGFFPTSAAGFPASVSYSVALDGTATTNYASALAPDADPAKSILAAFADLTNGEHSVQLTLHSSPTPGDPSVSLQFDRAVLTAGLPPQAMKQSSNVTLTTRMLDDEAVSFHGQWSFASDLLPRQNASFHTSNNIGDRASVAFNGTSVTLAGLTTPLSGAYNISLDGAPPQTFSARSPHNLSGPTLLFLATGLDPTTLHTLDVVNAGPLDGDDGAGALLIIGSVNVTTVATSNGAQPAAAMGSSAGLRAGTIAALAVGIFVAALVLLVLLVCYARRRRRARQRKQSFLVNPRVSARRLSFLRPRRSHAGDAEKGRKGSPRAAPEHDILDIRKLDDEYEDEDVREVPAAQGGVDVRGMRHASQNSDGSFSISLPELSGQAYARVRTDGDSPSPTGGPAAASPSCTPPPPPTLRASTAAPAASPTSPRSPRPRGPREMRSSTLGAAREAPQSILLKPLQPLSALPAASDGAGAGAGASGAPALLPPPDISPLRVNFEEGPPDERDARPRRKSTPRSAASGLALPPALRHALHQWGFRAPADGAGEDTGRAVPRYSFLDMDSSASQSSGSRSARHSHTASTRASSRSRRGSSAGEAGGGDARALALSMTVAGGPTSSHPSASPAVSLHAVPLPPLRVPPPPPRPAGDDVPQSVHPADLAELLPSPTESIPMTVSDIHFRYSTQSSVSVLEARAPPPPPVTAPPQEPRPYIVQRLIGAPDAGPDPSTPYGTSRVSAPVPSSSSSTFWGGRPRNTASGPTFSSFMPTRGT